MGSPGYPNYSVGQKPWFSEAGIQKTLNLTPQQMNQLNTAHTSAYQQYQTNSNKFNNASPQQGTQQQGTQQNVNPYSAYHNQMSESAKSSMSPQQYQRYGQLQLQYQGLGAFNDPAVQQRLNLTPQQIEKLRTYENAQSQRWGEMYKSVGYNPDRAQASYQTMIGQNDNLIRQVLNTQQQQTWNDMVGAPYAFQPHWENNPNK
jgi:hypothetical protein